MNVSLPEDRESARHYRKCSDWSQSTGKLNISVFVFRDGNRNGLFDLGDRPLASIVVEMQAVDSAPVVQHSNIAGFANFQMSTSEAASLIREAGRYRFEVVPPPGWICTTNNQVQEAEFVELPGSVSGLACVTPPNLVGLAPQLVIRGRVDAAPQGSSGQVRLVKENENEKDHGEVQRTRVGAAHRGFALPVTQGTFALEAGGLKRPVTVGAFPVDCGTIVSGRGVAADGQPWQSIDFETAVDADIGKIPSGYGGLGWNNFVVVDSTFYQGEGYVNGTVTGRHVAYNGSGHPAEIFHERGFDFLGCHLSLGWLRSEGEAVVVSAYQEDVLVALDRIELSALGPVWYEPRFSQVTRVRFATEHYWQFVMDGLSVRLPS